MAPRACARCPEIAKGCGTQPVEVCNWACEVEYLGFHLGHGQVCPQIYKTAVIAACPVPETKKEVRQFLGLVGSFLVADGRIGQGAGGSPVTGGRRRGVAGALS